MPPSFTACDKHVVSGQQLSLIAKGCYTAALPLSLARYSPVNFARAFDLYRLQVLEIRWKSDSRVFAWGSQLTKGAFDFKRGVIICGGDHFLNRLGIY